MDSTFDDDSAGREHGFGMGGFQLMGIMNAMKTGDMQTDMIIAMCLPFVLKFLFRIISQADDIFTLEAFLRWFEKPSFYHERFITHKSSRTAWGWTYSCNDDSKNSVLLKAIRLYLHAKVKLHLQVAELDLTGTTDGSMGYNSYSCDDDSDDDESLNSCRTMYGMLTKYKIIKALPNNEWHSLGSYGETQADVELQIETHQQQSSSDGDDKKSKNPDIDVTTFHFRSEGPDAIDAFIDEAYDWYLQELRKMEDNSRYYYELKLSEPSLGSSNDDGNGQSGALYKRYKLSDEKTFDSLFFREKESLLGLVKHFSQRSGKYAIKGYPHKLGLLLYGPAGTGKTSLIKALAQHTGRSIINVPLSKVSTNSELMSIFFDRHYRVDGADVAVKLNFRDVIFVMEDVDAASKVVKRRDGLKTADVVQAETLDLPLKKSIWRMMLESNDDSCKELVEKLSQESPRLKEAASNPEVLHSVADRMMSVPGLGMVGEAVEDPALSKVGQEAIDTANNLLNQYSSVDTWVSGHARLIKTMLERGTKVDDEFVDQLLGVQQQGLISIPPMGKVTRNISYTKYNEEKGLHVEGSGPKSDSILESMTHFMSSGLDGESSEKATSFIGPTFGKKNKDQLSLSGLLNVLDGVVDTPGRIVIMSTNHPEVLDPALIRPGRIDKKIMLGYMAAQDVISMLEHYFQTELDETQRLAVEEIVEGDSRRLNLTPAQVEQMAAEHDGLDAMLVALNQKAQTAAPKSRYGIASMSYVGYNV